MWFDVVAAVDIWAELVDDEGEADWVRTTPVVVSAVPLLNGDARVHICFECPDVVTHLYEADGGVPAAYTWKVGDVASTRLSLSIAVSIHSLIWLIERCLP